VTWLLLASVHDESARWLADRLPNGGLAPLQVVTDADLLGATWRHRIDDAGASTRVDLADGRVIDSAEVRGTLNRLTHVPPELVSALVIEDRTYAHQELSALVLSWLASLPGPVVNPPSPRGLCGAWRPPAEWAVLASEAGLCPAPVRVDATADPALAPAGWQPWPPFAPVAESVIVVGEEVFADRELDAATMDACRCLAVRAATPLLGLAFAGESLVGATPLPDVRTGDDLVAALVALLDPP